MAQPWVLSLDVGTSSVRAAGYTRTGNLIPGVECSIPHNPITTVDGGSEFPAQALVERCLAVLRGALNQAQGLPPPSGVAATTFWHSLVGLSANGDAITPVYLWADTRSSAQVQLLRQCIDPAFLHARTGCVPHTSYLPARLLWLQATVPTICAAVKHWVAFADYFYARLFGSLATSFSMASGSGLFDPNELDWATDVCAIAGISPEMLPSLVGAEYEFIGLQEPYRSMLPEVAQIPWFPAAGDGACSNVGSGCARGDRLAIMVGTSGAMRCVVNATRMAPASGLWCYRLDANRFVVGGALSNGGNLYAWLNDTLQLPPTPELEAEVASMEPDSHGLTVLPFLAGERSPGWAAHATGALVGLRLHTTPAQILRAGLEAVGLRFRLIFARLCPVVPQIGLVIATGGALLRSPAWMQIMADVLQTPVQASTETEASCRGAALLALEQLGLIDDISAVPSGLGQTYRPRLEYVQCFEQAAARQQRLYEALIDNESSGLQ